MMRAAVITVLTLSSVVLADVFKCDADLHLHPLDSYSYTCDNILHCVDGTDERGCVTCRTGRLLLHGLPSESHLRLYETTFSLQHYKLRNRDVYKTDDKGPTAYITYEIADKKWLISEGADSKYLLNSSFTTSSIPFDRNLVWKDAVTGVEIPGLELKCAPSSMRKCYGDIMLTLPDKVVRLSKAAEVQNNRFVYTDKEEEYKLQYVLSSTTWNTSHYQVVTNIGVEIVVFVDDALSPEFVLSPGIYNNTAGEWVKGSNVQIRCWSEMLLDDFDDVFDDVTCNFQAGTCNWGVYTKNDFNMMIGVAELQSKTRRIPPSLYVRADKDLNPGTYRITTPTLKIETESCFIIRVASTVDAFDEATLTVNRMDSTSLETVFTLEECTDEGERKCSELEYKISFIPVQPANIVELSVTVAIGKSEQYSGILSISDVALIKQSCDTVTMDTVDPCSAIPCNNGGICVATGITSYVCNCPEGKYGDHCEGEYTELCEEQDTDNNTVTLSDGTITVTCDSDSVVSGDNSYCLPDGTRTPLPVCLPKPCPDLKVSHGTVQRGDNTARVSCDSGFILQSSHGNRTTPRDSETVTCVGGTWSYVPTCVRDCARQEKDSVDLLKPVKVTVRRCDFAASDRNRFNFTDCTILNYTATDTQYLSPFFDLAISINNEGVLCARYGLVAGCTEACNNRGIIRRSWFSTLGKVEFFQVDSDFDYSISAISRASTSYQPLSRLILVVVLVITLRLI